MAKYIHRGNTITPLADSETSMVIHEKLPVRNYVLIKEEFPPAVMLQETSPFTVPTKMYGKAEQHAARILHTFGDRPNSTGVLLSGEKGSGKSLLGKLISIRAAEQGIPTIIVDSPWCGTEFNTLIQTIDQPCVIFFDEFEKVYDRDNQQHILSLLDGVFPTKKLFVFTVNDRWDIDKFLINRPGRMYYALDFAGLDVPFIEEYCADHLRDKHHMKEIAAVSKLFKHFTFDMLQALVDEVNRYGETPKVALTMLNISPDRDVNDYSVKVVHDKYPVTAVHTNMLRGIMPLNEDDENYIRFTVDKAHKGKTVATNRTSSGAVSLTEVEDDNTEDMGIMINTQHLVKIDAMSGEYVYKTRDCTITLTRIGSHRRTTYDLF